MRHPELDLLAAEQERVPVISPDLPPKTLVGRVLAHSREPYAWLWYVMPLACLLAAAVLGWLWRGAP